MNEKIKLKPGYDPTEYRNKIRATLQKERGNMTFREHMALLNEEVRRLYPDKKFIGEPDRTTSDTCNNKNG